MFKEIASGNVYAMGYAQTIEQRGAFYVDGEGDGDARVRDEVCEILDLGCSGSRLVSIPSA